MGAPSVKWEEATLLLFAMPAAECEIHNLFSRKGLQPRGRTDGSMQSVVRTDRANLIDRRKA